jgi:hypothetical protein
MDGAECFRHGWRAGWNSLSDASIRGVGGHMKTAEARLGITYEKSVGRLHEDRPFLKWRAGHVEDFEPTAVDLSLEAEAEFVERELESDIQKGKQRTRERWQMLRESRKLLPDERVSTCCRDLVPKTISVSILKSQDSGRAFYGNVKRCGSLWVCPICAARISERKRKELQQGLETWKVRGGTVYLLTWTVPHHPGNDTRALCDQLLQARERLKNRTCWRKFAKAIGFKGSVRALETTYGTNGSHVHIHELLFCMPGENVRIPQASDLLSAWRSACLTAGFPDHAVNNAGFDNHSIDIRDGNYAASYVGKWGLDCELTKSHIKKGHQSGRTAWDLLRASVAGDISAGHLFQQHARAFKGRRQLVWSRGLRALLGLGIEKTDEQLAEESTETAQQVTTVDRCNWRCVLRNHAQADLLITAETEGEEGVKRLLRVLADRSNRDCKRQVWRN